NLEATAMSNTEDRIYACEVKRSFIRDGQKIRDWKRVPVAEALSAQREDVRCAECHGAVRLHGRNVAHGPAPHAEHRSREDSEFCRVGHYFRQAATERHACPLTQ